MYADPVAKKLLFLIPLTLLLAAAVDDHSFAVDTSGVAWQDLSVEGMPPGLKLRPLHENPRTKMSSSMVRYPKGFREPRHLHKSCGHYIYILKGKLGSPSGELSAGMFTYAAPNQAHGPYTALEPTEILFYTDGPFDFIVDE